MLWGGDEAPPSTMDRRTSPNSRLPSSIANSISGSTSGEAAVAADVGAGVGRGEEEDLVVLAGLGEEAPPCARFGGMLIDLIYLSLVVVCSKRVRLQRGFEILSFFIKRGEFGKKKHVSYGWML